MRIRILARYSGESRIPVGPVVWTGYEAHGRPSPEDPSGVPDADGWMTVPLDAGGGGMIEIINPVWGETWFELETCGQRFSGTVSKQGPGTWTPAEGKQEGTWSPGWRAVGPHWLVSAAGVLCKKVYVRGGPSVPGDPVEFPESVPQLPWRREHPEVRTYGTCLRKLVRNRLWHVSDGVLSVIWSYDLTEEAVRASAPPGAEITVIHREQYDSPDDGGFGDPRH